MRIALIWVVLVFAAGELLRWLRLRRVRAADAASDARYRVWNERRVAGEADARWWKTSWLDPDPDGVENPIKMPEERRPPGPGECPTCGRSVMRYWQPSGNAKEVTGCAHCAR